MSTPFKIFVVEDDEWYNKFLLHNLTLNPDFIVEGFFKGNDVLNALDARPDVITLDYRLPDIDGRKLLSRIREADDEIEVVVISEQEDIETAIELLKGGAYDYLVKTKDIAERLHIVLNNIRKNARLKKRIDVLQQEVERKYTFEKAIVGSSPGLKKVYEMIAKATETNITVSITGETGTGKEITAKSIHYSSARKNKPFIAVNMAAIPAELAESELFGHEKGSFTGAIARRKGKFEEADGGTLFLDEIGDLNLNLQAKLLRVLQEKEVTPIGSNAPIKTDCRIIVASSKNLQDEVKNKNFRNDLYYRLLGLPIHLPPLRERDNDVLILAKYFCDAFCRENKLHATELSEPAKQKLLAHSWPGNVRELKSVMELAVVMASDGMIHPNDITLNTVNGMPELINDECTLREYNRRIVRMYMHKFDNNTKKVADHLDIGQTTVYRLMKEFEKDESKNQ